MKAQYLPCIIFSVESSDLSTPENAMNKRIAENAMTNMGMEFEKLVGVYNGVLETSYLITDMNFLLTAMGIAKEFNQESVLLRDNENNCTLKYLSNNELQPIGKLESIHETEACEIFIQGGSYTYKPSTKQYFTCRQHYRFYLVYQFINCFNNQRVFK